MFIDWASQLNLLEHNPETHILKEFSLPVQKVLVQQVVTFLLGGNNAQKALSSEAHIRWAMEACGQGFSLPIEEEESIGKVITLYRIWAIEIKHRPKAMENNIQFFMQKILEQSSLIFEPRSSAKDLSERHAMLCSQVLDIYSNIGRTMGSELSEETWEVFLKILIGISDSILRNDAPPSIEPLQRRLVSQLQKVLFELWLLSRTRNPLLWEALQQRVRGWTKHMALILAWKVVTFALTKRTVNILYGSSGSDAVVIKFDDSIQHLALDSQYVFYAWHRILNLIGNPNETIMQPSNLLAFMNGVELTVNQFLKIGFSLDSSKSSLIAPTGNTILHIFGSWLFDCVLLNRPGFEEGTALAMKILSNIMITNHKTDFLPVYVSSYFSCLQRALSTEGRVLVAAITSSTAIFTKEIKGIRCLVPLFFSAIQKVLSGRIKSVENVMPPEHFRKACLQIFGTIICFPNHLRDVKFATKALSGLEVTNYTSLKVHFSTLLTEALTKETNLGNTELLLNLSYIWVVEDIENNCDFARQIIGLIIRKVTQNRWGPDVIIPAFNILTSLSCLYPKIDKGYEQANLVVDQLCRIITNIGNPPTPNMEPISVSAFRCISHWIMTDQWLFNFKETRHSLLTAIVSALTGKQTTQEPQAEQIVQIPTSSSKKKDKKKKNEEKATPPPKSEAKNQPEPSVLIQEAAHSTLMTILNHLGNFPTLSGASVVSSLALEDEILQEIVEGSNGEITPEKTKDFMRYYITDDRLILCVIDRPYHVEGPRACIIVRDKTGRYAWDTNLTYSSTSNEREATIYHEDEISISASPFQPSSVKPMDVNELSSVLGYLSQCSTNSAFKPVEQQVQKEYKVLKRNNFRLNADISTRIPEPAETYSADCKFQQSRMFMSHVGYLSLENRSKLFPLNMNSSFFEALRQLDEKAERICVNVGVLYGRKGQTEDDWFANEGGSLDYQEFVSTLGWGVNVNDHRGHKGIVETCGGELAPYWSNYSTEIVFQVPTLVNNRSDDPGHDHKRKQALHCSTLVLWLEDFGSFQAQMIWKHVRYNITIIVIVPLDFGLYSVRMFSKNDLSCLGPICDGCVLSKAALGHVVRDTCILAWQKENGSKPTPTQARVECIDRIYELFKRNCNLEQFYTNQFTVLEGDQISPLQLDRPKARPMSIRVNPKSTSKRSKSPGKDKEKRKKKKISRGTPESGSVSRAETEPVLSASSRPAGASRVAAPPSPARAAPPSPARGGSPIRGAPPVRGTPSARGSRPPPPSRPAPARGGKRPAPARPANSDSSPALTSSGSWVGSRTTPSQQGATRARPPPKLFGTQRRQAPPSPSSPSSPSSGGS